MKDFTKPTQTKEQQQAGLTRRLVQLQVVGTPIFIGAILSAMAYFGDIAVLPMFEDRQFALNALLLFGVALVVESVLTIKTVRALAALRSGEP
ncbi:MAG: hypothetical protein AAGJ52_08180 [Pseudomonadota bacterium]